MEGFLKMNIGIRMRAVLTRIITIIPCVAVAVAFPSGTALNMFVNGVNVALSILLVSYYHNGILIDGVFLMSCTQLHSF